jgi:type I restriction enzyme M protein
VKQEKTMGFLEERHINKIFKAYQDFTNKENFSALITSDEVLANNGNMSISLYVRTQELSMETELNFEEVYDSWKDSSKQLQKSMNELFEILDN